jgi:hypothetical protein
MRRRDVCFAANQKVHRPIQGAVKPAKYAFAWS